MISRIPSAAIPVLVDLFGRTFEARYGERPDEKDIATIVHDAYDLLTQGSRGRSPSRPSHALPTKDTSSSPASTASSSSQGTGPRGPVLTRRRVRFSGTRWTSCEPRERRRGGRLRAGGATPRRGSSCRVRTNALWRDRQRRTDVRECLLHRPRAAGLGVTPAAAWAVEPAVVGWGGVRLRRWRRAQQRSHPSTRVGWGRSAGSRLGRTQGAQRTVPREGWDPGQRGRWSTR